MSSTNTVQILGPDNVLRSTTAFSTTQTTRFFTGTLPTDTVDVEVSVYGGAYTSDPTLVSFSGTGFVIPNPASFPDGLNLFSGDNAIGVRAVGLLGGRSTPATVVARLLPPQQVDVFAPPTAITIERLDGTVKVTALGLTDIRVTGYNFYAATETGGGNVGYSRINLNAVFDGDNVQNITELYALTSDNITQSSDPLYLRARIDQEQSDETVLSTDVNSRVEIPQSVTEIQTSVTISSVDTITYYSFGHNRTANNQSTPPTIFSGRFASTPPTDLLYYVVTAVYFDTITQTEFESYFSSEVVGAPAQVRQQISGLQAVSRQQILENAIATLYRQNPDIAVQPGSVVRDTFLDPFTTESERLRLLLDYVYRASSFDTLLLVDDPSGSGVSVTPASSSYKTVLARALFYSNIDDVQKVIDGSFDKIAANFNIIRKAGTGAVGEVRFFTSNIPTQTVAIPLGTSVTGGSVQYRTTRSASLPVEQLASYYNPATRLYSVTVPIKASTVGRLTNVGARQISSSNVFGMGVTNDAATFGGADEETNSQLAARARTALSSVDTGTSQGYLQTAASVPGTIQTFVVRAGSPLMQRDYDPTLKRHMGGTVDVWARGNRPVTVTDTFAFTYERKNDAQFVVIGNPLNYTFRSTDESLTPDNPLARMLDYASLGIGLRNVTTGEYFDLTDGAGNSGVTYLNFNTIQLNTSVIQPPVNLTDIVLGDYRYILGNKHVFSRQPVNAVIGVAGEQQGALDLSIYSLVYPNSPLGLGQSTLAGDYLQISQSTDPTVVSPTGNMIPVSDEFHTITGYYTEYLFNLGAESLSLVVTNQLGTVTYNGPFDPSGSPDYTVVEGTSTSPVGIKRTITSTITDGQPILISYEYYENFVVTYQTNLVTSTLQQSLDDMAHATANVVAKQAVAVPVNITATVILRKGSNRTNTDIAIRNNLQYLVGSLRLGDPLRRSDVIATMDNSTGVSYVVVPLTLMVRASGTQVVRNDLDTGSFGDSFRVESWSNSKYATWLILQELDAPTLTGGGASNKFRAVYQDDEALNLQLSMPQNLALSGGSAFIIGKEGLAIPGYGTEVVMNRVLVSLPVGDSPSSHSYWATYITAESAGNVDVDPSSLEYIVIGDLSLTFDEELTK